MTDSRTNKMPPTDTTAIAAALQKKYAAFTGDRNFTCDGWSDNQTIQLTVVLKNLDESFFYPVEGRIAWREEGLAKTKATNILTDMIDSYFQEYLLNDGEVLLPIDWQDYTLDDHTIQLRGQIQNRKLEKLADEILASGETKHH